MAALASSALLGNSLFWGMVAAGHCCFDQIAGWTLKGPFWPFLASGWATVEDVEASGYASVVSRLCVTDPFCKMARSTPHIKVIQTRVHLWWGLLV